MDEQVRALLEKRRNRSIAKVLGFKERECDRYLPGDLSQQLRKTVLDEFNDFYDLVLDILNSLDNGSVILSQLYLDKLDEMYDRLVQDG